LIEEGRKGTYLGDVEWIDDDGGDQSCAGGG